MANKLQRRYMRARLSDVVAPFIDGMRPPRASDVQALGSLMLCAYRGTTDYEGESESEAVAEVERIFAGEHGAISLASSRLIERDNTLVSAALITHWQFRPLVAILMTREGHKGKGLARACMVSAMQSLFVDGEFELRLVVTLANLPAVSLYESLGFVVEA